MSDIVKEYDAFVVHQTLESKPLILFAASALEIEQWAGVPERRKLANEETTGFQRQQDPRRITELLKFFGDRNNVVQNPLLGALQDNQRVQFLQTSPDSPFGRLRITYEDHSSLSMMAILKRIVAHLESRVSGLEDDAAVEARVASIMRLESAAAIPADNENEDRDFDDSGSDGYEILEQDESTIDDAEATASVMLAEETHLVDFYTELRARIRVLEQRGIEDVEEIQGFTKSALIAYLKPVVLVDGQHRLRGAVESAYQSAKGSDGKTRILNAVKGGISPELAEKQLIDSESRRLPVSLLMDDSPSEHVFQFVVVNQKATPMGKALLGTIVSTSLSRSELAAVADRLRRAGIKLEDSQSVAYLTRAEDSPFRGLVQTGMTGDRPDLLQWTVLRGLVSIFRELRGGRPYNQKIDYARAWKSEYFPQCGLVGPGTDEERFEEWSRPDGPWRDIFVRFFSRVRDHFGDPVEVDTFNGWGSTATSNLFNKVSLTILAADFFDFLYTQSESLADMEDFERTMNDWLKGGRVSSSYFNRDWRLESVKKDQLAVKRLWAQNWQEYRKVPASGLPKKFKP
ncbi:hypothetical protein [Streptomyces sp. Ru62]|uniref:hypothetical protein n=1 Tax=Streptomyces sp. Ru62 TaxID=2080745 RepID=UPI0011B0D04D|nr:hypothetical protein [Streptomyces sp. Ru62]